MKHIRRKTTFFFIGGENFKKEFRRQLRLLIIVTLGFTIAFTWRQTVFDTTQSLVVFLTKVHGSAALSILTSTLITIFSLAIMYITSMTLQDHSND